MECSISHKETTDEGDGLHLCFCLTAIDYALSNVKLYEESF